jgi:hypothetical protein
MEWKIRGSDVEREQQHRKEWYLTFEQAAGLRPLLSRANTSLLERESSAVSAGTVVHFEIFMVPTRVFKFCDFYFYHHGMARPQVAVGGDGLQIWRVATNILNKQSRTTDKGWSSSLGVGRGADNSSP